MVKTQSIIKWVGGKSQIIDRVLDSFPSEINNYHEPFIGGGSVLLALLSSNKNIRGKIRVNDINTCLIQMYKDIQSSPEELILELEKVCAEYFDCPSSGELIKKADDISKFASRETYYYWVRQRFNDIRQTPSLTTSALFIFLNKTGFRGMYREGPNGFNIPYGNYKKPEIYNKGDILNMSRLIKDVEFHNLSYEEFLTNIVKGDFVYLDPPYALETKTSFVGYNKCGFGAEQQNRLFELCHDFVHNKVAFAMSNSDVPIIKENFPEDTFVIDTIECRRSINSKNPGSKAMEVIITPRNYLNM
ncbi:adenine-specific methyltransferase [Paramecium bursaria Chlorella virus CVM-1]|nr:adenine-specific methyltransferase [Paramecium bursaria Chlorella virus CVM-1]